MEPIREEKIRTFSPKPVSALGGSTANGMVTTEKKKLFSPVKRQAGPNPTDSPRTFSTANRVQAAGTAVGNALKKNPVFTMAKGAYDNVDGLNPSTPQGFGNATRQFLAGGVKGFAKGVSNAKEAVADATPLTVAKSVTGDYAAPFVKGFINGSGDNNNAVAAETPRRFAPKVARGEREAHGALVGDEARVVGGNMSAKPQETSPQAEQEVQQQPRQFATPNIRESVSPQRDAALGKMTSESEATADGGVKRSFSIGGNTMSLNLSEHDLAVQKSIEDIDNRIAQGFKPNPEQAQKIQEIREQAGSNRGGTDKRSFSPTRTSPQEQAGPRTFKTGNLEVQFDDSVDPAAQKRFLAKPAVTPTEAQLEQYDYQEGLKSGRTTPPVDPTAGMGPKERIAYRNTQANTENNIRNNKTGMAGVESQDAERQTNIAGKEFALEQSKMVADLQNQLLNAPDEKTRAGIERQLRALGGKAQPKQQIFTERSTDPVTGESVSQNYSRDADGNVTRLIPEQFPTVPTSKDELMKGQVYQTHNGLGRWEGKQFRRMELDQYGRAQPTMGNQ